MTVRYKFTEALGAFFLADAEALKQKLPKNLYPLEPRPGYGVLSINAFNFSESEVGAYHEVVVSILVPPWAPAGTRLPHFAVFPFFLATDTEVSRHHATDKWRFPHYNKVLKIDFNRKAEQKTVTVTDGKNHIFEYKVLKDDSDLVSRFYQAFSVDQQGTYRVEIEVDGLLNEHEKGLGELILGEGPIASFLDSAIDDRIPVREQSMNIGSQIFGDLTSHR